MSKDPRFATGPTLADDVRDLLARVKRLEANRGGFIGAIAVAGGASGQTFGYSGTAFTLTGDTSLHTDDKLTITTPTLAVVSHLLCFAMTVWSCNNTGPSIVQAQFIMDDATAGQAMTPYFGSGAANSRYESSVIDVFASVAASAHTIKLQWKLNTATDTVTVRERRILVLAIPA